MHCGITNCGMIRQNNEDSFFARNIGDYTLLIVADGMGGHNGGEIASSEAVKVASDYISQRLKKHMTPSRICQILQGAVNRANMDIFTIASSDQNLSGMGTTVDVCVTDGSNAYIAHVGDSRVYKINNEKKAVQITRDHSLVEYMIATGQITRAEAENHPQRHMITRALGTDSSVEADTYVVSLSNGDTILLCTDGLSNMLNGKEIAQIVLKNDDLSVAASALTDAANNRGGFDNITVVMYRK